MSVLRSHNNKTRGGLGRVCATGMYRSTEHVKFPTFQTGIFVEWKASFNLTRRCVSVYLGVVVLRAWYFEHALLQ